MALDGESRQVVRAQGGLHLEDSSAALSGMPVEQTENHRDGGRCC